MKATADPSTAVKMTIRGLMMDPTSKSPVVILGNQDGKSFLPIWIGVCEANSIAIELEGVETPRPMTHDLIRNLIIATGCTVEHIFIHSLDDSVFKASIQIRDAQSIVHQVDSRPSDAIALAMRMKADVLVDPSVLEKAVMSEASEEEALREILGRMRPEDMGDYEM